MRQVTGEVTHQRIPGRTRPPELPQSFEVPPRRAQAKVAALPDVAALIPGYGRRSERGDAALRAVARGILERVARHGTLRPETIPATWPMTRHLVRRVADALVTAGLLERLPDGALRTAGAAEGRAVR